MGRASARKVTGVTNNAKLKKTLDDLARESLLRVNTGTVGPSTFVTHDSFTGSISSIDSYTLLVCQYEDIPLLADGLADRLIKAGNCANLRNLLEHFMDARPGVPTKAAHRHNRRRD